MLHDYFAVLHLEPGEYTSEQIRGSFLSLREPVLRDMRRADTYVAARHRLEELHEARRVLGDPARQRDYLSRRELLDEPVERVRVMIAAALEDGLVRHSRRQAILSEARRHGIADFHVHLMIAQEQFAGSPDALGGWIGRDGDGRNEASRDSKRAAARLAAAGVLGLALLLSTLRWLSPAAL
jgi:hypothetical protein